MGGALAPSPVGREALDDPAAPAPLVRRMLTDIARLNRVGGGHGALHRALAHVLPERGAPAPLTLLDIGTGAGDLPRAAVRWAARRGIPLRAVGLERHRTAARLAQGADLPMVVACGGAPPLAPRSVDLVLVSQVAHHLDHPSLVALLAACDRIARRGVMILDLRPSRTAAFLLRLGAPLLRLHPVTVADGITSLARGFAAGALAAAAREAGATRPTEWRHPIGRVTVAWRCG